MLLWALLPFNPYSYYVLLRWVVCGVLAWQFATAKSNRMYGWAALFFAGSIVYNPLVAFTLSRLTWSFINVGTVVALIVLPFTFARRLPPKR